MASCRHPHWQHSCRPHDVPQCGQRGGCGCSTQDVAGGAAGFRQLAGACKRHSGAPACLQRSWVALAAAARDGCESSTRAAGHSDSRRSHARTAAQARAAQRLQSGTACVVLLYRGAMYTGAVSALGQQTREPASASTLPRPQHGQQRPQHGQQHGQQRAAAVG